MEENTVLYEVRDHVALVTFNRPTVMNAMSFQVLDELEKHVETMRNDSRIWVVIFTGAGNKAFSAGADLKERAACTPEQVKHYVFTIRRLFEDIEQFSRPVISAVNGIALGGGTELALASDICLASETATFGLTETRLAVIPGAGGTQRLPRVVGRRKAKELIYTGRRINAAEALRIGLVNHVYPAEELLRAAFKLAEEICQSGPIAVQQAKYAINRGLETDLSTGLAIESNAYWLCIPTEDRLEGLAAFKEKRQPVFKGR